MTKPHNSEVTSMAFSDDGRYFSTGASDGTVFLFSVGADGVQNSYAAIGYVPLPPLNDGDEKINETKEGYGVGGGAVTNLSWRPDGFALMCTSSDALIAEIDLSRMPDSDVDTFLLDIPIRKFRFKLEDDKSHVIMDNWRGMSQRKNS